MGVIVEKFSDNKGIIWPENIAPFTHIIIPIGEAATIKGFELYNSLSNQ
jgi:prolyl-tRNA synthetase